MRSESDRYRTFASAARGTSSAARTRGIRNVPSAPPSLETFQAAVAGTNTGAGVTQIAASIRPYSERQVRKYARGEREDAITRLYDRSRAEAWVENT
jgi:hypothetical protein